MGTPSPSPWDLTLFGPEWLAWLRGRSAAPAIPAPGSMLELLPSSALSPAQVIRVYGRKAAGYSGVKPGTSVIQPGEAGRIVSRVSASR
jgi:hypothetical protein